MKKLFLCVSLVSGLSVSLRAEVKVPAVFSDHAVLQAEKAVAVWGTADVGEKVSVSIATQEKSAVAGADGKWQVKLDPMAASAKPLELKINARVIQDVLVGEVWLGSGQSNMAMQVKSALDLEGTKAKAALPLIRVFTEGSGASDKAGTEPKGSWVLCSAETVGQFSATAFFFGRAVQERLQVPVGLLVSSVGGTPIESWISPEAQRACEALKPLLAMSKAADAAFDETKAKAAYEQQLAKWTEDVKAAKAAKKPLPRKPLDPVETQKRKGNLGGLFNGKISPLIPYTLRGALWYQGEANSADAKAPYYQTQLTLLAQDWRQRWGDDFAFAWAQLPNFTRPGEGWSLVREAMRQSLKTIPNSGMGINLDIGDPKDIHPKNKQEVGRRLALWALGTVYGKEVEETSGPLAESVKARGAALVVTFTHSKGLMAKGDLVGFEIAGADGKWLPAVAQIDGATVSVSAAGIQEPRQVRYAWKDNPVASLWNAAGLPASPFIERVK